MNISFFNRFWRPKLLQSIWTFYGAVKHIFLIDNSTNSADNPPRQTYANTHSTKEYLMTEENRPRLTQIVHGSG